MKKNALCKFQDGDRSQAAQSFVAFTMMWLQRRHAEHWHTRKIEEMAARVRFLSFSAA